MTSSERRLPPSVAIVFAKPARAGHAKTRLAESIGAEPAAALYAAFLVDTARMLARASLPEFGNLGLVLAHEDDPDHASFSAFHDLGFRTVPQGEGNLGAKLARVVDHCFEHGAQRLVVVGSDSPTLLDRHLSAAFDSLRGHDVVLGPTFDGGYYLVGLGSADTGIFERIDWSTNRVLGQTLRRARSGALLCELLEFWYDIDTSEDLERLQFHLLEYLSRRDHSVARETSRVLRELEEKGPLEERRRPGDARGDEG